ncbi:PREDICTED: lariat debranching enzyme B-like [Priapulus caudatus]|uniref:Lariat debranching enzyme B-like n=1 Tax=Priapulus caudatus TaxID=37621 RepID=A0ABM1EG29_PRICU|nr:PREDICTED: lariat debranching enzyme B-like [Priapulus caudatus]
MKFAVEGCCHGELDKIYETIEYIEKRDDIKIDLLICCGDFQAVRNRSDLRCMAVPPKFQKLNTFYKYYSGEKKAPILTLFIGGNHEASNYLGELPYGGWVAPNIYYMGYAGVVRFGGLRIAGITGIFKGHDYLKGHFEKPPYGEDTKRSVYHVRNLEVFRLKQLTEDIDICISHDWPRGIYNHGNTAQLLRNKPFFREEVETNKLGSWPAQELMDKLQPTYWFSAHLHVKFAAVVQYENEESDQGQKTTKFLALDKCLPRRKFLQVIDFKETENTRLELEYDKEWLAVLQNTNHLLNTTRVTQYMPGPGCGGRHNFTPSEAELRRVDQALGGNYAVPKNFQQTVPPHSIANPDAQKSVAPVCMVNPQTVVLCQKLGLDDPHSLLMGQSMTSPIYYPFPMESPNADESNVTAGEPSDDTYASFNPDEITVDLEDDSSSSSGSPKLSHHSAPGGDMPQQIGLHDEQDTSGILSTELSDGEENASDSCCKPLAASSELRQGSNGDSRMREVEKDSDTNTSEVCLLAGSSTHTSVEILDHEHLEEKGTPVIPAASPKRDSEYVKVEGRQVKKFRRRNAAIYQAQSEDSS